MRPVLHAEAQQRVFAYGTVGRRRVAFAWDERRNLVLAVTENGYATFPAGEVTNGDEALHALMCNPALGVRDVIPVFHEALTFYRRIDWLLGTYRALYTKGGV